MYLAVCSSGERNEIWFNRNLGLQESCADALDCDTVLTSLFNYLQLCCQSNPVFPFSAFNPAAITAKIDTVPK